MLRPVPVAMMTAACLAATAVACGPPSSTDPPNLSTTTTAGSAPTTAAATTTTTTTTTTVATTTTLPDGTALYSPTPVDGWGILKEGVGDQYVDAVEIAGNAAYAGGLFTHAVKGTTTADRANLMSVDLSTGNLRSFKADTNGSVNALASDGAALYLGGTFTTVNGVPRSRVAKVDLTTGAVDPTFVADVGALVDDMVVVGGTLYLGGEFNTVDGVDAAPRRRGQHDRRLAHRRVRPEHRRQGHRARGQPGRLGAVPRWQLHHGGHHQPAVPGQGQRDHGRGAEPDVRQRAAT